MKENIRTLEKAAFLFIVGGIAGAGLALLFAPQSGVRTRRQIQRAREDLGDRVEDFRFDLGQNLDKLVEESKGRVEKSLQRAKDLVPTLENGREMLVGRSSWRYPKAN